MSFLRNSYFCLLTYEVLFPSHSCTFILMTWLLFYSSFKQLINELHTSDMIPPCPIISSIYFYSTKHCRFVNCLRSQIGSGGSYFNSQNNATVVPHWWHRVIVNHHVRSHKTHHKSLVISCNKSTLFYWVKQLSLNLPCNLMSPRLISPSRTGCGMRGRWPRRTRESRRFLFFFFHSFSLGVFYNIEKTALGGWYLSNLFRQLNLQSAFSPSSAFFPSAHQGPWISVTFTHAIGLLSLHAHLTVWLSFHSLSQQSLFN